MAHKTCIRVALLRGIENEAHDELPAPVFVKGFLRTYARAVGADEDETLRRYEYACQVKAQTAAAPVRSRVSRRVPARLALIGLALGGLIVLAVAVGSFNWRTSLHMPAVPDPGMRVATDDQFGKREPADTQATSVADANSETLSPGSDTAASTASPPYAAAKSAPRYTLVLEIVENTELKVIIDEHKPKVYSLQPGKRLVLEAVSEFNILISNATGVKMELNGKPYRIQGRHGHAVNINIP